MLEITSLVWFLPQHHGKMMLHLATPICFRFTLLKSMYQGHTNSVQIVCCTWILGWCIKQNRQTWCKLFYLLSDARTQPAMSLCNAQSSDKSVLCASVSSMGWQRFLPAIIWMGQERWLTVLPVMQIITSSFSAFWWASNSGWYFWR